MLLIYPSTFYVWLTYKNVRNVKKKEILNRILSLQITAVLDQNLSSEGGLLFQLFSPYFGKMVNASFDLLFIPFSRYCSRRSSQGLVILFKTASHVMCMMIQPFSQSFIINSLTLYLVPSGGKKNQHEGSFMREQLPSEKGLSTSLTFSQLLIVCKMCLHFFKWSGNHTKLCK